MRLRTNQSGVSLVELSITVALAGLSLLFIGKGLMGMLSVQSELTEKKEIEGELTRALSDVLRVGRIAQRCSFVLDPLPATTQWLECRVDVNHPPTIDANDDTTFRFGMVGTQFQWLKLTSNTYHIHMNYQGISSFEICDDALMESGQCKIPQQQLNLQHTANFNATSFATPRNRFFRVRFVGMMEDQNIRSLQSAFTVRHPTSAGILYQWGQIED